MTRKSLWLLICSALVVFIGCQKPPMLSITSPTSIELSADGSSGTISFTANREWTISTSDSWVSVSPSRGDASDGQVSVSVYCSANTTYEDRTATVTIRMEDLTQTVTVRQPANLGIILPAASRAFDLSADANTIVIEVQANVPYIVSTTADWIKQAGTKALSSTTLSFSIEKNETYEAREGSITINSQNSSVPDQVISVKQAQKDALIVKDKSFDMPYGGGEIEFKVEANVDFAVTPSEDWIHYVETKALSSSTVRLTVDENPTYSKREGKIEIKQKNGSLSHTITVRQAERIAVTSVTLNKTEIKLKEGETETLVATVKPDNATDKTVTWTSSDPEIAIVDETGLVTALKEGPATITAKAGEKTAICSVTVKNDIPVTSVDLDKSWLSLVVGDQVSLTATVKPDDATDKTITWISTNERVATVDSKGVVTAVGKGNAEIIVVSGDIDDYCKVFVKAKAYGIPAGGIDLGLSVVWAEKNYGAYSPSEVGGYYLWGDPTGTGKIALFTPPSITNISGTEYDIARKKLGSGWRLPTVEEISELFEYCAYGATSFNGVNGVEFTGPNGSRLFIPLSGMGYPKDGPAGSYSIMSGDKGFIMTGDSYIDANGHFAYIFSFEHGASYNLSSYNAIFTVFPIRPVFEKMEDDIPVSSIALNKNTLSLSVGQSETLIATVYPDNATDKTVNWSSSDTGIATVDQNGKVSAIKEGNATIIAQAESVSVSCQIIVRAANYVVPSGAVDLGLSVVWASKNLGASSEYEAGSYYLWGDPSGNGVIMSFTTPNVNNISNTQYDIALATMGNGWRLPSRTEVSELLSSCSWEKVSNGVRLTGPNGNSIILPLTGMAFPSDGRAGSTSLTSTNEGFIMTGESYADAAGRFAYVYHYNQNRSYNWSSYNAPMAKFPVRPVYKKQEDDVPVSSITLNKTLLSLNIGQSETLIATVSPDNATDKTVAWNSSNTSIAAVDQNGRVTAIQAGSATITAKAGDLSASCSVNVQSSTIKATSITISKNSLTLSVGGSESLTVTLYPSDAMETVHWGSNNPNVASVDSNGKVTGIKAGNATITAIVGENTATCEVTVVSDIIAVTSVTLDQVSLALQEGESAILNVTIKPDNATDKAVTWSSDNSAVASVDNNGKVTAVKEGSATITATAGDKTANCSVSVSRVQVPEGAVDLGIVMTREDGSTYRLFWAKCNIGANKPEEYGDYYAWGETETKQSYSISNYKWMDDSSQKLTKYNTYSPFGLLDNKTILEPEDDVASVKLGSNWRTPTKEEWDALWNNCILEWSNLNGVNGYIVTSKNNGNSVFLPAGGYWKDTELIGAGFGVYYWSSSLNINKTTGAWAIAYSSGGTGMTNGSRYDGKNVRPVTE